jgi:hypothetical protein
MTVRRPRYPKEEFARRGRELYEQKIRQQVEGARGKLVAVDIETGDFELADTGLEAAKQLLTRRPDAQIWVERIGYRGVQRFGRSLSTPAGP